MKKALRITAALAGCIVLLLVVGPLLVPLPPLEGTQPVEQLADRDSRFLEVNGVRLHYKSAGQGEPVFILLHGFASSEFSWREVMQPLAGMGRVIAYDRPAFGLTERPMQWTGENPYSFEAQVHLLLGLMDQLGVEKAILVGNSAGGTVAVQTALAHPERVERLILVDAAIYEGERRQSALLSWLMQTPQARRLGPLFVRRIQDWGRDFAASAWHDPSQITPAIWEGYTKPLKAENWDRALWEFTAASRALNLAERLDELTLPVLVISGDDDRIVPTENSLRLAQDIPQARLVIVPACGHVPHEEHPDQFMNAIKEWLKE